MGCVAGFFQEGVVRREGAGDAFVLAIDESGFLRGEVYNVLLLGKKALAGGMGTAFLFMAKQ